MKIKRVDNYNGYISIIFDDGSWQTVSYTELLDLYSKGMFEGKRI